jgi:hypothetical protein
VSVTHFAKGTPSSGQPVESLRPPAPAPVRTAVKLMYAGATVSAVPLIIALASIGDIKTYHGRWNGHSLTAASPATCARDGHGSTGQIDRRGQYRTGESP